MSNDYFTVTNYHLDLAKKHGENLAKLQIGLGHTEPLTAEELWDEHPEDELVYQVTGEKMHDVEESALITDSFEEGYFYYGEWL